MHSLHTPPPKEKSHIFLLRNLWSQQFGLLCRRLPSPLHNSLSSVFSEWAWLFLFQSPILASTSILVVLLSIFYSFSQFLVVPFYELDQPPPTLPSPPKKKKKIHTSLIMVSILIISQKNYVSKQGGNMKRDCPVLYTELTIKQFISSTIILVKQ